MKKIALIITSVVLLVLSLSYLLLFTPAGNGLLQPHLEAKINQSSPAKIQLSDFVLNMHHLRLVLKLDEDNSIVIEGDYSLFSLDFDINYFIDFKQLSNLNTLAQRTLLGRFSSEGNIKGDIDLFKIKGQSNLAKSQTEYAIIIADMQLDKAAIKMKDVRLHELLSMVGEKPYAAGKINLHVQLNDLDPHNMQGSIALAITEASLDAKTLKKELGLELDKTSLQGEFKAKLEGAEITYLTRLSSEIINIDSKGKLLTKANALESDYRIDIKELALFKSITHSALRGPFYTEGKISGKDKNYSIEGKSNIADSDTKYTLDLHEMRPAKLLLTTQDAKLEKILYMAGEEKYAKARLNADIKLNSLDPDALEGKVLVRLSDGTMDNDLMQKVFAVKLPKTEFILNTAVVVSPENINYSFRLSSNLAMIDSKGDIHPKSIQTKADYKVDIKELALLKPLTAMPLRGPFETSGTLQGDKKVLLVDGRSTLAQSLTQYAVRLEDLHVKETKVTLKKAELSKLLYLAGKPSYAKGNMDLDLDLKTITPLSGKADIMISEGLLNNEIVKESFEVQFPYTRFELKSKADIKDGAATIGTTLDSNLALLKMKKTQFDLKSASFSSDYTLTIPSLERFESILERKLYGEMSINGDISKNKHLDITAQSKAFQGQINAKIHDEQLNSEFKGLHAIGVLKMLGYPEILDASTQGSLVYNMKTKQGRLDSSFDKAALTRSQMTELISRLTRTDLSKEHFNKGTLISIIDKEIITSDLDMQSKDASVQSKKFVINSKKRSIDARFSVRIKKDAGDVLVQGAINDPSVRLDAKSVITPEVKEKLNKEINRFLKKLF